MSISIKTIKSYSMKNIFTYSIITLLFTFSINQFSAQATISLDLLSFNEIELDIPWTQIVSTSGSVPYHNGPNDGVVTIASMTHRTDMTQILRRSFGINCRSQNFQHSRSVPSPRRSVPLCRVSKNFALQPI